MEIVEFNKIVTEYKRLGGITNGFESRNRRDARILWTDYRNGCDFLLFIV